MSRNLELVKEGYANGVAPGFPLNEDQKWEMVDNAAEAYGKFLDALGYTKKSCKSICIRSMER